MYQPGAPAALPGKVFIVNDQNSRLESSDNDNEILGPPVVGPSFYRMLGFGANNSTDTNKIDHPSRLNNVWMILYIIITQIKIQARKERVQLGKFFSHR